MSGGTPRALTKKTAISPRVTVASGQNIPGAQPVVIRADARTPHQAVVTAMDVVSRLGLVNISLATVHSP